MTTYLSWLPTLDIGSFFGSSSEDNQPPSSNTTTSKSTSERVTQSENNTMFGFWEGLFGNAKVEKYSPENLK
jgi:hypothetical protein